MGGKMRTQDKKEDWLYNYALYHGLAHWTAYIAILVVLLTIGLLLSTQINTTSHRVTASFALVALWLGEVYLVFRIMKLGNFVHKQIGETIKQVELLPHPYNHLISLGAATLFCLWDILLVFGLI